MWIIDCCAAAGSIVVMRVAATATAVITGIKTEIFWGIMSVVVWLEKYCLLHGLQILNINATVSYL
jgi:hypothetical protein